MTQPPQRLPRAVVLALIGQSLLSAGTHLSAKVVTAQLDAVPLVTVRLVLAAIAYAVVLAALPGPKVPPRNTWGWLLGFGFVAGPLNQGLFLAGLQRSKATHASLMYALTPLGVYLLGVALGRERPQVRKFLGIAVALAGVVTLLIGRGLTHEAGPLFGDVLLLGAVVAWVAWTTESRKFAQVHGGLRTAAWSIIAGGICMVPVVPVVVTRQALQGLAPSGWWGLAYLVVMTSLVSYALWNYALARVEASRVAIFANLQPIVTAVASWLWLDEVLGYEALVAGVLVLIGVRLATASR